MRRSKTRRQAYCGEGRRAVVISTCLLIAAATVADDGDAQDKHESTSRLSDEPSPPFDADSIPTRPKPLLELGNPFLGAGELDPGFEMPGGAVWQPSLLIFGTYRTALQTFDDGERSFSEWANRLDLFANLQFSGTERLLAGIRPLDQDNKFSGFNFHPDEDDGWQEEFNGRLTTLFFEGDFGQIFPKLDPEDAYQLDYGFAVGRQPLFFQEGMLINDTIDAVGITRDTLLLPGGPDLRITALYGWDNIDRDNNREDGSTHLFGVFTESDVRSSTIDVDAVYIYDNAGRTSGLYWGASAVQRIGHLNTAFRMLGSYALDDKTPEISDGHLLFGEVSWTPPHTHDLAYINGFWGIDEFSSAARGPDTGGPLGRTGILFAAVGLGRYGAALGNRADDAVGAGVGYQMFLDKKNRRQLIFELGGRTSTTDDDEGRIAVGGRYQQAIGQHKILRFDLFGALPEEGDESWGARVELQIKF